MREKRPALVITFPTTAAAMGCEALCIERGLPGRTILVPGGRLLPAAVWRGRRCLPMNCCAANSPQRAFPPRGFTVIDMWEVVR